MSKHNPPSRTSTTPPPKQVSLYGSSLLPAIVVLLAASGTHSTVEVPLGDVVARAYADSGLTADAWNALPEGDRETKLNDAVEAMKADATLARNEADEESRKETVAEDAQIKMKGNGNTACNVFGVEYKADKDGVFKVPASAQAHLETHGFTRA